MRQGNYLNVILTVNAVLLGALVWTQVAETPLLADSAVAQSRSRETRGVPNASAQRQRMIEAVQDVKRSMDSTTKLLQSGNLKVEVTNLSNVTENAAVRGR